MPFDRVALSAPVAAPPTDSSSSHHWSSATSRVIVAIPDAPIEETQLAKEIWALTSTNHAEVVLLTLLEDWSRESHIRLQHTLVMQMLATTGVRATSLILTDVDWLSALDRTQQPNDVLLCFAEHLVVAHRIAHSTSVAAQSRALSKSVPIAGLVIQQLGRPVHEVSGLLQPARRRNLLLSLLSWLGFAIVIVAGFWMQMRLDQLLHDVGGLLRTIMMGSSVALELGVLMLVLRISR